MEKLISFPKNGYNHLFMNTWKHACLQTKKKPCNVVVAMSGGVDSTVSAHLLLKEGFRVVAGVYMRNWDPINNETKDCSSDKDFSAVKKICEKLKIPCIVRDYEKEYWNSVFTPFLDGYSQGITPNPDISCNREIKFNLLYNDTISSNRFHVPIDYFVTGHYARTFTHSSPDSSPIGLLGTAFDSCKDQTYFLSQVKSDVLTKTLFPLGDMLKSDVKRIADENGFYSYIDRKESVGICFIGKTKFSSFLSNYLSSTQEGDVYCANTHTIIGKHNGTVYY
eukprot:Sdes_comp22733_c0_seq1m21143